MLKTISRRTRPASICSVTRAQQQQRQPNLGGADSVHHAVQRNRARVERERLLTGFADVFMRRELLTTDHARPQPVAHGGGTRSRHNRHLDSVHGHQRLRIALSEFVKDGRHTRQVRVGPTLIANPVHECAPIKNDGHWFAPDRVVAARRQRRSFQRIHEVGDGCFEIWMGSVASRLFYACLKQAVEPGTSTLPVFGNRNGDRYDRIKHNTADAFRVIANVLLCQIGTIGQTEDVPLSNAECSAEISEIGRVLGGVVRGQICAGLQKLLTALMSGSLITPATIASPKLRAMRSSDELFCRLRLTQPETWQVETCGFAQRHKQW